MMNNIEIQKENESFHWGKINQLRFSQTISPEIDWNCPSNYYIVPMTDIINSRRKFPKPHWIKFYYNKNDRSLSKPLREIYYDWAKWNQTINSPRILEIGCGPGSWTLELARRGCIVDAFDLSEETISIAQKYLLSLSENESLSINYFCADADNVKLKNNSYDLILFQSSIHHIINYKYILTEAISALKLEGKIIIIEEENEDNILRNIIIHFLLLILPTVATYREKFIFYWMTFFYKIKNENVYLEISSDYNDSSDSPFDGVTSIDEVIKFVKDNKYSYSIEKTATIATELIPQLAPNCLRTIFIRIVSQIDLFLRKIKVLPGRYIILTINK